MSLKILSIGDLHFNDNNKEIYDEAIDKILEHATDISPDYIVPMGDTLHKFAILKQIPRRDAVKFLLKLSKIAPTIVLIGNHDRPNPSDFLSEDSPFFGMKQSERFRVVTSTLVIEDYKLGGLLVFVPYVKRGKLKRALLIDPLTMPIHDCHLGEKPKRLTEEDFQNVIAVFGHHEIKGCEYNGRISKNADSWKLNWPFFCSGHIHEYQWLRENVLYVGTPFQHDFGDLTKKSISLLTFKSRSKNTSKFPIPEEKRIFLGLKERQVITMNTNDIKKWNHDPTFIWKIKIEDNRVNIDIFYSSNQYKDLVALGVVFEESVQFMEHGTVVPITSANGENYMKRLWKRIEGDALQEKWLDKFEKDV